MEISLVHEGPQRTFVVVLKPGEEAIEQLGDFAREHDIEAASFTAIGGFQGFRLGFFNLETRDFDPIPFHEHQVEILSLSGQINRLADGYNVHGHTVLGQRDGSTLGGHLLKGVVQPILIATVEELAHHDPKHQVHHHGHSHHGAAHHGHIRSDKDKD